MSNFRFAKDYALHRLKAKTRHGTHSPFVYRLVDKVIYDFSAKKVYDEAERELKSRPSDKRVIHPRLAQLLCRLVADLRPANMIELGATSETISVYLKKAAPNAEFHSLENDGLPAVLAGLNKIDFAFINDMQTKETVLRYFDWLLPKVHDGTLLVFSNIYQTEGMKEAWAAIKSHPQVTVTVDMFWMGLVYFRKGQAKEDFKIKI
ncbi:MAG: SAM-dependent methyltransferase [Bacteroidetes bacterium]|nr:SAM-dependent methyltransferase [Bacteroidota bacterium]